MISPIPQSSLPFVFERDTFAFANELVWEYRFNPTMGATITWRNNPRPAYVHRCFVLARSARQFLYHARFDPALPPVGPDEYRRLIRAVVSRSPRRSSPPDQCLVIPGYGDLRSFSREQEALLKRECGGAWQSYALRSHWRMVFPISRRHQRDMAAQLLKSLPERLAPVVHLVRFPQLTINHGIVLFEARESPDVIEFTAYDPNIPAHPVALTYHRAERRFHFPRTHYWPGGTLDVIEVYRGGFY